MRCLGIQAFMLKNCIVLDSFDYLLSLFGIKQTRLSEKEFPKNIPQENFKNIGFGLIAHFFPIFLFITIVSFTDFSLFGICIAFASTSVYTLLIIRWSEKNYPAVNLEPVSKKDILKGLGLVFVTASVFGTAFVLGGFHILSHFITVTSHFSNWVAVLISLLVTDFSYYWIHRSLNHGEGRDFISKWYRKSHAHHHAIKALDFYRGNLSSFFDTALIGFQIPLIFISVLLGMNLETVLASYCLVMILQSTHHANHTFNIGALRYIFVDNHSHKLHHCPRGYSVNFGALFAIWDIFFRTYYEEWNLSASFMAEHSIALPIKKVK